jgi:uncharacterized membrane protein YeaQ/YmgE (transglycosylase-associated protein family)
MDASEILALIIVGLLAGSAAAAVMGLRWLGRFRRKGRGSWLYYTVIGVVGALVGQLLFQTLDISLPDLFSATITVAEIVIAFVGAVIVILVVGYLG